MQADLDVALNVFDQGQTYPLQADPTGALSKARNKLYQDAQTLFEKLGARDDQNPICWTAKAWAARCMHMLGDFPKAKERYKAILRADARYAADAIRLTRYFYLLLLDEAPSELRDKDEDDAHIVAKCKEWISEYPGFLRSPEGYGVRFLLGEEDVKAAATEKDVFKRKEELADARKYFRQVEESENDFTDRARREKIEIIAAQQGGFKESVEKLTNFEDCYVRAQYEMIQEAKGEKEAKTPEDADKVRQEHGPVIVAALERGLKLDEQAKGRGDDLLELANAKAMMTYQYMNAKKYREAVAVGEKFAKSDPRSSQAAAAAVYVLLSYVTLVGQEAGADKSPAELSADRKSLFDFAQYMERTWPKEPAGDMARHQLALLYINAPIDSDDPDAIRAAHAENVHKAIEVPGPNYAELRPVHADTVPAGPVLFQRRQGKTPAVARRCGGRLPQAGAGRLRERAGSFGRRRSDEQQGLFPRQIPSRSGRLHAQEVRRSGEADGQGPAAASAGEVGGERRRRQESARRVRGQLRQLRGVGPLGTGRRRGQGGGQGRRQGQAGPLRQRPEAARPGRGRHQGPQAPGIEEQPAPGARRFGQCPAGHYPAEQAGPDAGRAGLLQGVGACQRPRRGVRRGAQGIGGVHPAAAGGAEAQGRRRRPGGGQEAIRRDPRRHPQAVEGQTDAGLDPLHGPHLFQHGRTQGGGRTAGDGAGADEAGPGHGRAGRRKEAV